MDLIKTENIQWGVVRRVSEIKKTAPADPSDEALVRLVLEGDKNSYGVLIERYKNLVFRIALDILKHNESAEDASQEVFIKTFKNLDRLENPKVFASWLGCITRNVCIDMKRKQKEQTVSIEGLEGIVVDEPGFDGGQEARILHLKRIIDLLPEKHSMVIKLRYTKGFSCKKTADLLGINERAVVNRLYYARKLILEQFKKEGLI